MFAVISVIIFVGGGVSSLTGLALLVGTIRFLRVAESSAGVVVGYESKVSETPDQDGFRTAFVHPVVEFEDRSGRRHRVTLATGTAGYRPYTVGLPVEILCPPDDPSRARIRGFLHLWLFPAAFTVGGVLSMVWARWFYELTSRLNAFGQ